MIGALLGMFKNMSGAGKLGVAQSAIGLGQTVAGLVNMRKTQREADKAVDAISTYKPSQEISGVYEGAKLRSTTGMSGSAKALAKQGVAGATASGLRSAQNRKAGLAMTASGVAQEQQSALQLGAQEDAARNASQARLTQAAGMQASEKEKAQKSAQEKETLKANIAMQKVQAKKQMVNQGLAGLSSGASTAATGGNSAAMASALKALGFGG